MQRFVLLAFLLILGACARESAFDDQTASEPESKTSNSFENIDLGTAPENQAEPVQESMGADDSTQQLDGHPFPKSARLTAQEANSRINLRSQPSTQSPDQGYGLVGDPVQVLKQAQGDDGFTWYWVKFDGSGAEGWIRSDFVAIVNSSFALEDKVNAARLSIQQKNELLAVDSNNALGIPVKIVIPTYVPNGFEIRSFIVEDDPAFGPSYGIIYTSDDNRCFEISAASGGFGAGAEDFELVTVNSKALGRVELGYTQFDSVTSQPRIGFNNFSVPGVPAGRQEYTFWSPKDGDTSCQAIEFQEAVKIVESLDYLNP